MKICALCNEQFNDGVLCRGCKKHLDFGCANISETSWRKLGAGRQAQWKCATCRTASPVVPTPESTVTLETLMNEIRDMKRQLLSLPTLSENLREIKEELTEVKCACEYSSGKLDEFTARILELENKVSDFQKLHDTVNLLQKDLQKARLELTSHEQRSRQNNLEIKGVPLKKEENLFSIVEAIGHKINYNYPKTQINYISRIPMRNSKDKLIIVSFVNKYIKEEFIAAARTMKTISTSDLGFAGQSQPIYVNDHLSVEAKQLLNTTKTMAKDKNYKYVWVKHTKIHVSKNDTSKAFVIRTESDLNKVI